MNSSKGIGHILFLPPIEEIRSILSGTDARKILSARAERLKQLQRDAARQLSVIEFLLEGKQMKYQVTMKEIPEMIVYTAETTLPRYSDCMQWIPSLGQECLALNPAPEISPMQSEYLAGR